MASQNNSNFPHQYQLGQPLMQKFTQQVGSVQPMQQQQFTNPQNRQNGHSVEQLVRGSIFTEDEFMVNQMKTTRIPNGSQADMNSLLNGQQQDQQYLQICPPRAVQQQFVNMQDGLGQQQQDQQSYLQICPPKPVPQQLVNPPQNGVSIQAQQTVRGDRHVFTMSDDNIMTRQIQDTHYPDGRQVDIKPLLCVVEDILQPSTLAAGTIDAPVDTLSIGMIDRALAYTVNKISCEISCKCSGDGGANASTMALLNTLSSYSWEAKVVLILAAFAVNYGEFCLVEQLHTTNELAKSIAILKQLPEISKRDESLSTVIKNMMDITKCIIEFTKLPAQYISNDTPALADAWACFPNAVYWTIRSIVACSSQITNLVHLGNGYLSSANETWELSIFSQKLVNIHIQLAKQLDLCKEHIGPSISQLNRMLKNTHVLRITNHIKSLILLDAGLRRQKEAYDNLIRLFGTTDRINQMEVLKAVICARTEVQLPLYGYSTNTTVKLEVLTRKHVLLLISDLEISNEEVSMLAQMYSSDLRRQYEVVWLPVVDQSTPWTVEKQKERFNKLKCESMPWYSLHDPELLEPWVIKYIKEVWHFTKKPILVVLDQQGRVVNENALHMMWIWGSAAFPFTRDEEHALWNREQNWKLDLLVDCIDDPKIKTWMEKKELICLYGGENMEWIEKFTSSAQTVSKTMKLVYVGKSNPKERVKKNNGIIQDKKLGYIWHDLTLIWFFWARLESMWYSKMQCGKTVQNDLIMHEIMKMLSFDGSDQGWAVITDGSTEMVKAKGELILTSFTQVDQWKVQVDNGTMGFVTALNGHLQGLQSAAPHHCNRLILPGTAGSIPGMVACVECNKPMERYIMYRCCTD